MRTTTHVSLLGALLLAVGCQAPSEEAAEQPVERAAAQVQADFNGLSAEWQSLANSGDAAAVAALYAENAVITDPYGTVHEGPEAILSYFERYVAAASEVSIATTDVRYHGDMVAGYGTWSQTVQGPEGEVAMEGTWQTVSMYQPDGSVRILLHHAMIPTDPPTGR